MRTKTINARELRRQYELLGPDATVARLSEAIEQKHLKPEEFSIRELFVGLIEGGSELFDRISTRKSGGMSLVEAATAVDTSAFSNITGQIIYSKILDGYNNPEFLWPQLCETVQTNILGVERMPGIGGTGDVADAVDEAALYPMVGLSEEFVDLPATAKRGFVLPVTREIIVADRTGLLLKVAQECGKRYLGINKEKRVLNAVTGVDNTYTRNSVATNTYLTSGSYINSSANTLLSWASISNAELLFDGMTDPNTGEPVVLAGPRVMLVPSALRADAMRIVKAMSVDVVDNQVNATTYRTLGANPIPDIVNQPGDITVVSSAYVKKQTGSASKWFYGQPQKAFVYREVWGIEVLQAADNSEAQFMQDVWMRFKTSERGAAGVQNPRYMTANT